MERATSLTSTNCQVALSIVININVHHTMKARNAPCLTDSCVPTRWGMDVDQVLEHACDAHYYWASDRGVCFAWALMLVRVTVVTNSINVVWVVQASGEHHLFGSREGTIV